jgi:hypothetical protein
MVWRRCGGVRGRKNEGLKTKAKKVDLCDVCVCKGGQTSDCGDRGARGGAHQRTTRRRSQSNMLCFRCFSFLKFGCFSKNFKPIEFIQIEPWRQVEKQKKICFCVLFRVDFSILVRSNLSLLLLPIGTASGSRLFASDCRPLRWSSS